MDLKMKEDKVFKVIHESVIYNCDKDELENLKLNDKYIILKEDDYLDGDGALRCLNIETKEVILIPHYYYHYYSKNNCFDSIEEIK